jgi:uncharacterized membrane protein
MSTPEGTIPFGPVQMLVLEFDETKFTGEIMGELQRLKEADLVRVIDLLIVTKGEDDELAAVRTSDLRTDEAMEFGALIGALVGLGAGEDIGVAATAGAAELEDGHLLGEQEVWYLGDVIPKGGTAAIALLEHRWAIPLRDKIVAAGGMALADEWIHPADLIAVGLTKRQDVTVGA